MAYKTRLSRNKDTTSWKLKMKLSIKKIRSWSKHVYASSMYVTMNIGHTVKKIFRDLHIYKVNVKCNYQFLCTFRQQIVTTFIRFLYLLSWNRIKIFKQCQCFITLTSKYVINTSNWKGEGKIRCFGGNIRQLKVQLKFKIARNRNNW